MKKQILLVSASIATIASFGAGFGIYEASARGNSVGGTLVGSTKDASAVYYNPANMTEVTNVSVMVGSTFLWLSADESVNGVGQSKMNPGMFCIPNFYITAPVWGDLYAGLGIYCEDGLGTKYGNYWALAGDTTETTMEQFTFNPNLAYKITDWWSVAGGLKFSYIYFDNKKHPQWNSAYGTKGYNLSSELEGDDCSIGYNFGTTFRLMDNADYGRLALGIVYRSQIKHDIKGDFDISGTVPYGATRLPYGPMIGADNHSLASAKLTLPQSITTGLNWDSPNRKWHAGFATTFTEWSCVDTINFRIPATKAMSGGQPSSFNLPLNWHDVWRFGWGLEYDILDDLTLRGGYVYDMDPSSPHKGTTMLPGGDRNIFSFGFGYYLWSTLRLDLGYSLVMMDSSNRQIELNGARYDFKTSNAFSHMMSASVSYTF